MGNLLTEGRLNSDGKTNEVWSIYDSLTTSQRFFLDAALEAIKDNRQIKDRISDISFTSLSQSFKDSLNYEFREIAMGSGGVGQLKIVKNEIRLQIGYGHSINNFAKTLVIFK